MKLLAHATRNRIEELELARRAGKRQAAPFSKGEPKSDPRKPGRKPGEDYGRKAHRAVPVHADEEIQVFLPGSCPDCGGEIEDQRVENQYQQAIVRKTRVTCFKVHVGHCVDCGARVQGRHPQQTSDALGAAASQIGPEALSLATLFNTSVLRTSKQQQKDSIALLSNLMRSPRSYVLDIIPPRASPN